MSSLSSTYANPSPFCARYYVRVVSGIGWNVGPEDGLTGKSWQRVTLLVIIYTRRGPSFNWNPFRQQKSESVNNLSDCRLSIRDRYDSSRPPHLGSKKVPQDPPCNVIGDVIHNRWYANHSLLRTTNLSDRNPDQTRSKSKTTMMSNWLRPGK